MTPRDSQPLALDEARSGAARVALGARAVLLHGFARVRSPELIAAIDAIAAISPFRHMVTPGGWEMSAALTNCGQFAWVTDRSGYRYDPIDPGTGRSWPAMPQAFADLAVEAAGAAGFDGFRPDACLVNRYAPGARLSLHQDRNERGFDHPIVSVLLGLPAIFLWGGKKRRQGSARSNGSWRCRGMGRPGPSDVPWRPSPGRGRASVDRRVPLQLYLSAGALRVQTRLRAALLPRS